MNLRWNPVALLAAWCLVFLALVETAVGWAADKPSATLAWQKIEGARVARLPVASSGRNGFAALPP